jgi:hypothetical protein
LIFSDESDSVTVNTQSMFSAGTGAIAQQTIGSQTNLGFFGFLTGGNLNALVEPNDNVITDHDYKYTPSYPYATPNTANPRGFFQFTPEEGLGALIGESAVGTWTLKITDNNGRDVGVFDRFNLAITTIPKPCILDLSVSGSAGCVDTTGTVSISGCSNQFPLKGVFIKVDTISGTKLMPRGTIMPPASPPTGTRIEFPLGTTVFSAFNINPVTLLPLLPISPNTDTTFSRNPRVTYTIDTINLNIPAGLQMYPDPAIDAQTQNIDNVKVLTPFKDQNGPNTPNFPATLPRHGFRLLPVVAASQAYCRWPARIPDTETIISQQLEQIPTDSIGIGNNLASTPAPDAKCKAKLTISLDTAATPGIALINVFDLDAGSSPIDDINGSNSTCFSRGKLRLLNLGGKFGTDCTPVPLPGMFRINYNNGNTIPALNTCSDITVGATHNIKINESLAAIIGSTVAQSFLIKVKRPTTPGSAPLGAIAVGDFKAIVKFRLPNGTELVRPYHNAVPIAAPPANGNFDIPLSMIDPMGIMLTPTVATVSDVSVETKFTLNSGKISNLSFDLGTVNRDSLRFTSFPRTVTCADIGKPTKVILMVKDRVNKFDTCTTIVTVTDKVLPTIQCGTNVTQELPSVDDCAWFLTGNSTLAPGPLNQLGLLGPVAMDKCLSSTSLTVPLAKATAVAAGISFMIENTTDKPIIVNSLNFPIVGTEDMLIRAYVLPFINGNAALLETTDFPSSTAYPILNRFNSNIPGVAAPNSWLYWGQSTVTPAAFGAVKEIEFLPKNSSNLTLKPTATAGDWGVPYAIGNKDIGTSLIIPPGTAGNPTRWGVYLVAVNGNNTTRGIVHSNIGAGGVVISYPFPLPVMPAVPTATQWNTMPPMIIRAGWNSDASTVMDLNEIESSSQNTIANPAPPPFPVFSPVFEGVVNFPLGHALLQLNHPTNAAGGRPRMFAGKVNYVFGEPKTYTPALGPANGANTDVRNFIVPTQGPRGTVSYFQKPPVIPTPASSFLPSVPRSLYTYNGIKQISGIDYQKPYPIGKTVNVFQVTDMAGNTATCSQTVEIKPKAGAIPPQLICNDLVNISLDAACTDALSATEFLANTVSAKCLGAFKIEILNGTNVLGTQTGTYNGVPLRNLLGGVYEYKVIDASNTNNFCWGKVKFEDKFAPKISCPANITVDDCSADVATSTELIYT